MLEPYVWYDPWELIKESNKKLEEAWDRLNIAKDLEYYVGHTLNAMARAHEYDTCQQKQQNAKMLDMISEAGFLNLNTPVIVKK